MARNELCTSHPVKLISGQPLNTRSFDFHGIFRIFDFISFQPVSKFKSLFVDRVFRSPGHISTLPGAALLITFNVLRRHINCRWALCSDSCGLSSIIYGWLALYRGSLLTEYTLGYAQCDKRECTLFLLSLKEQYTTPLLSASKYLYYNFFFLPNYKCKSII